ncbi:bifunctional riboflavin kinase/FAD synthetase [soil metagenome]
MELIRGLYNLRSRHSDCAVTIGSFDGVHLGHQALLRQLAAAGRERELATTLVSFEPLPGEYFKRHDPPARLTRLREKCEALAQCPLDRLLCLRFDADMARWPASAFIERILIHGLGVRYLIVGADFRFGQGRQGDVSLLRKSAAQSGFDLAVVRDVAVDGRRISSTAVRRALAEGRLDDARRLLGREYRMSGRVIVGDQVGRRLGFPTANIAVGRPATAVHGVFAVRVSPAGSGSYDGVASVGTRPTVDGRRLLLEVHLFDFDGDLYRKYLHVDFVTRLRDEARFASLEEMRQQMRADADRARDVLRRQSGDHSSGYLE